MNETDYEYSSPITIYGSKSLDQGGSQGGPAGVRLASPFGQEACEWAVQLVNFEAAGTLVITPESGGSGAPSIGPTNDGGFRGYMLHPPAAAVIAPVPVFTPLTNGQLYFSFNVAGGNVTVVVVFRRHRGHIPQWQPMYHTNDPEHMERVNAAREAAFRGGAFPTQYGPATRQGTGE